MTSKVLPIHHSGTPTSRGSCDFSELPASGNIIGDRIAVVDRNLVVHTWSGTAWVMAGTPSAFTSRALTAADHDAVLLSSGATVTINTGLFLGFGCVVKGAATFTGSATITDERSAGSAFPCCTVMCTGANAYSLIGGKA